VAATEVVIVSGSEYAKYEAAGNRWVLRTFSPSNWIEIARNWALQEFRVPDTTVTVFDIARGTQETFTDGRVWTRVRTLPPPATSEWWRITNNKPGQRRYARPVSPLTTTDPEAVHVAYLPGSAIPPNQATIDDSYQPVGGRRLGIQNVYDYICSSARPTSRPRRTGSPPPARSRSATTTCSARRNGSWCTAGCWSS
jgi:hypothetical protein